MTDLDRLVALPDGGSGTAETERRVALDPAAAIRSERVRWLWEDRIPLRGLVIFAGEKGLGKSITTNAWLAAQVTCGELEGELKGKPTDVLIATAEDDWASVIKPRLMAHGADLDRVHRVRVFDDSGESLLTLPDDVPLLEGEIGRLRGEGRTIGMLVVDPIGAFLSGATDSHRDSSVRRALAPLAALAERLDLAVPVVAHLTKDETKRLIARVSGAGAFVNAARSVLVFAPDPGDPEGEQGAERVLVHVRSNWGQLAPSLGARIESRDVEVDDGSIADVGCLVVTGETSVGVEDLQRGPDENGDDCEEAIGAALVGRAQPSSKIKAEVATQLGCSRRTVERAAQRMIERGELAVESGGFPRTTTWALSPSDDSGDTGRKRLPSHDNAVATTPDTRRVVTGSYDDVTEDSALSDDSDSLSTGNVATGDPATPEQEADLERVAAKFGGGR